MADNLPVYKLYAIRYARRDAMRSEHFVGGDPHDGPMPMDYFVWAIIGEERSYVLDVGYTEDMAAKRKRTFLRCPAESLSLVGLDAKTQKDVVISHLHYDHAGNFHKFPVAEFHMQEPGVHFATGRYMRYPAVNHPYEPDDIVAVVRMNFGGRVRMYNGDVDLAPGISLHATSGHAVGLQFMRVNTQRGWVVLAADVTHYYENMDAGRPFPTLVSIPESVESYEKLRARADSRDHIIPGHDPLVLKQYPAPSSELEGIVARLDVDPKKV